MLLDAAILAVVIGLLAGGRLSRLKDLDLRGAWLFVLAAALQVVLMVLAARGIGLPAALSHGLYLARFALVLGGIGANYRLPGARLVGVGVALNFLVVATNGGSMPVDRGLAVRAGNGALVELLDSPTYTSHTPVASGTRLRFLGDVLPLPLLVPRPKLFSPGSAGDILVTVGGCWLILAGMGVGRRGGPRRDKVQTAAGSREEP